MKTKNQTNLHSFDVNSCHESGFQLSPQIICSDVITSVLLKFFGQGGDGDVYNINWLFSDPIISEKKTVLD